MKTKSNGRQPQNMEYLSNHWLKFTHILNFSEGDKVDKISKLDYLKAYSKECDLFLNLIKSYSGEHLLDCNKFHVKIMRN